MSDKINIEMTEDEARRFVDRLTGDENDLGAILCDIRERVSAAIQPPFKVAPPCLRKDGG